MTALDRDAQSIAEQRNQASQRCHQVELELLVYISITMLWINTQP
jgi:hypothetical protein